MYKVIVKFADLKDNKFLYDVGDMYPRDGVSPTPERVDELLSNKNRLHTPLIVAIPDKTSESSVKEEEDSSVKKEENKVVVRKRRKKAE